MKKRSVSIVLCMVFFIGINCPPIPLWAQMCFNTHKWVAAKRSRNYGNEWYLEVVTGLPASQFMSSTFSSWSILQFMWHDLTECYGTPPGDVSGYVNLSCVFLGSISSGALAETRFEWQISNMDSIVESWVVINESKLIMPFLGEIVDADIYAPSLLPASMYDLRSIIIHEAGHAAGLPEYCGTDTMRVMNWQLYSGHIRRTLKSGDIAMLTAKYP